MHAPPYRFRFVFPAYMAAGLLAVAVGALLTGTATQLLGGFGRYHGPTLAGVLAFAWAIVWVLTPSGAALTRGSFARWSRLGSLVVVVVAIAMNLETNAPQWLSSAGLALFAGSLYLVATLGPLYRIARACRVPPVRLVALLMALLVGGATFGVQLGMSESFAWRAFGFGLVALACELAARLPPLALPWEGKAPWLFAIGVADALRHRNARNSLLGLCVWAFVATLVLVALIRVQLGDDGLLRWQVTTWDHDEINTFAAVSTRWLGLAALVGIGLMALQKNSFRAACAIPYAAVGSCVAVLWWLLGEAWYAPLALMGVSLGMGLVALVHYFLIWTTPKHHAASASLALLGGSSMAGLLAIILATTAGTVPAVREQLLYWLLGFTGFVAVASWLVFLRPAIEGTIEVLLWPVYRIRGYGAIIPELPDRGPCMVIANHAAWWDPLWLAKILPPPTTPMMTSKFYDLPVVSWLMRRVMLTIRVPDKPIRHEAPELNEAVAALDRGDCLVIFPEGYLRRKEEVPLRRFGRGVWHILSQRPQTPVYACWIDGNWGSYFSHRHGPPTKNKKIDFWYPIKVGVVGPIMVEPALLADHMATRLFLMNAVNQARQEIGLPLLDLGTAPEGDQE